MAVGKTLMPRSLIMLSARPRNPRLRRSVQPNEEGVVWNAETSFVLNLITGWKFGKTESQVNGEIQHFRVQGKDYIVVKDQNRSYFLDRRGKERLRLKSRVVLSPRNPITLDMNIREEKPRWISTDSSGNVMAAACVTTSANSFGSI